MTSKYEVTKGMTIAVSDAPVTAEDFISSTFPGVGVTWLEAACATKEITYLVRVRAINAAEISSGWGYSQEKTLTGKVGNPPKPVGFMATGINWGIRLNWGFPANTADTLKTEIQYTANSDFSDPLLLSDVPYPSAEYTQLGLRAGQEFWYRAQLVDKTGNESGYTDWIRGMSNDNADDYLGDIADEFLSAADGERLTSDIDTNLEAALQNALANHGTVEHQWAQYGEVRADNGLPNNYGIKPVSVVGRIQLAAGQTSGYWSFAVPPGMKVGFVLSLDEGGNSVGRRIVASGNTISVIAASDVGLGNYPASKCEVVVFMEKA